MIGNAPDLGRHFSMGDHSLSGGRYPMDRR
jgi:hypothetical protein